MIFQPPLTPEPTSTVQLRSVQPALARAPGVAEGTHAIPTAQEDHPIIPRIATGLLKMAIYSGFSH